MYRWEDTNIGNLYRGCPEFFSQDQEKNGYLLAKRLKDTGDKNKVLGGVAVVVTIKLHEFYLFSVSDTAA